MRAWRLSITAPSIAMTTSALSFLHRSYTPLAFREQTERRVIALLSAFGGIVWLVMIPLELVLY
jgi:hypothetical protein